MTSLSLARYTWRFAKRALKQPCKPCHLVEMFPSDTDKQRDRLPLTYDLVDNAGSNNDDSITLIVITVSLHQQMTLSRVT